MKRNRDDICRSIQYKGFQRYDRGSTLGSGYDGSCESAVRPGETSQSRSETRPVAAIPARVLSARPATPTTTLSEALSPWAASRTIYVTG